MATRTCLKITRDGLFLNKEPFYLASGSMHYFRIHPTAWRKRLKLMVSFGLTAVQTYVPWNLHEPQEGSFCFEGLLDLAEFMREADEAGLKVLLRPSPFINSEFDLGGLPWWLLKRPDIELRSSDSLYLECVAAYYKRLCREFVPMLSTHGGPIIAVAIENEYGGWAYDPGYLTFLRDGLTENGVDVPFDDKVPEDYVRKQYVEDCMRR
jgi:beta-galactosidase